MHAARSELNTTPKTLDRKLLNISKDATSAEFAWTSIMGNALRNGRPMVVGFHGTKGQSTSVTWWGWPYLKGLQWWVDPHNRSGQLTTRWCCHPWREGRIHFLERRVRLPR